MPSHVSAINFGPPVGGGGAAADQESRICGPCKHRAGARPPPRKRPQEAALLCGLEPTPKVRGKARIACCVQQDSVQVSIASSGLRFRRAQQSTNVSTSRDARMTILISQHAGDPSAWYSHTLIKRLEPP